MSLAFGIAWPNPFTDCVGDVPGLSLSRQFVTTAELVSLSRTRHRHGLLGVLVVDEWTQQFYLKDTCTLIISCNTTVCLVAVGLLAAWVVLGKSH